MENRFLKHQNLQKAVDHALYLNFQYRVERQEFGVIQHTDGDYVVIEISAIHKRRKLLIKLPKDYSKLSYEDLKQIGMDEDPLHHWEELKGVFSTMNGELLRFILKMKIPLKRFIRYELANRGYDENNQWVGFDESIEIWLK